MSCKYLRKALQTRKSRLKRKAAKTACDRVNKLQSVTKRVRRLTSKVQDLSDTISKMNDATAATAEDILQQKLQGLSQKQQLAVRQCFEAAKRKSTRGMKYNKEWMLECILLKMRSPKLYDYIRRQNILVIPGKTTIRKYIASYMANFGFNENMLQTLKEKTSTMDPFKCQGGIVIDEMKLSEHLSVDTAGRVSGFVDLGAYTPKEEKQLPCDHGLVVMFVPLTGSWSQILGTFATRTNIKGELLAKIVLEATILAEKAGLFVNYVTCDAATWNRKMWRIMGVRANSKEVIAKRVHPSDDKRSLYFLSDFPHLVKNIRNRLLQTSFHTPDGKVSMLFF